MNISKYIELLRFYLTEKVDELNEALNRSIYDELREVSSYLLSAVFSVYISYEFIDANGWVGALIKIIVIIVSFYVLKMFFSKVLRHIKTSDEFNRADKKRLTEAEAKKLISRFDHVACDGVLLSWDFFEKFNTTEKQKTNERLFYLFEAFYYYNKAVNITSLIVSYHYDCVNSSHKGSGVSFYRLNNIYESLSEINKIFNTLQNTEDLVFENSNEFFYEIEQANIRLEMIKAYVNERLNK